MSHKKFYSKSSWASYSRKLASRIENPKFVGFFTPEEAGARQMRLAIGQEGRFLALYWLVDTEEGVIVDVKFQAFGSPSLIGAAESACELLLKKNYDQARRITAELIDRQLCDQGSSQAFPQEAASDLNLVLSAIDTAADQCTDIPFADTYSAPPMNWEAEAQGSYPGWKELPTKEKIAVIEAIIAQEIRPYIELDAGGVQILDFVNDKEVIIAYQGSCTSCHSATGATLNAIQQILRAKVDPEIVVTPDLSYLSNAT